MVRLPAFGDSDPVVISVVEPALADSLEQAVQTLGLATRLHDPRQGLASLGLAWRSTLIVDREVLPRDPLGFLRSLRTSPWRGLAIVLAEDSGIRKEGFDTIAGVRTLDKPFMAGDLLRLLSGADAAAI
jgi:hypothetical protein